MKTQTYIQHKEMLSEREAADYIGMSRSFLRQDRMTGYRKNRTPGPSYLRIGRNIRYPKKLLNEWITQHTVTREHC